MAKHRAGGRPEVPRSETDRRIAREFRIAARHLDKGRHEKALALLSSLAERNPEDPLAATALGQVLERAGRREEAMACYRRAFSAAPDHAEALLHFARLAQWSRAVPRAPELLRALEACFLDTDEPPLATPHASARDIARLMGGQLAQHHRLRRHCLPPYREGGADAPVFVEVARALAGDRLFRFYLQTFINLSAEVEYALTLLRRRWLLSGIDLAPPERLPFLAALAVQGALNEHAWFETPEESAAVAVLAAKLESWPSAHLLADAEALQSLLLYALYRAPSRLANADDLREAAGRWPEPPRLFARTALVEPLEERALAAAMPRLTPVEAASAAVREQYEANPYPRWRHKRRRLPGPRPPWLGQARKRALVAGCGTGREPINHALAFSDLDVLAVDLSAASLAYGSRRARELGVERVEFAQADILNLAALAERFEFISAQGVSHHMEEPEAGLAVLAGLLAPGGLMRLGLYSERGRSLVIRARALIAEAGYRPTADDMRRFRVEVLKRPDDHPLRDLAVAGNDFYCLYCLSGLRDYLFHVREHRFSPAGLKRLLERQGLRFLGFEIANAAKRRLFREMFADAAAMADLDLWARFEQAHPDMVEGLYAFWCRRI